MWVARHYAGIHTFRSIDDSLVKNSEEGPKVQGIIFLFPGIQFMPNQCIASLPISTPMGGRNQM